MIRNYFLPAGIAVFLIAAWPRETNAVEIACHRGANEYAPENTRASTQLCIDWGMDYVEIDVRRNSDGVMYLMHDATVKRTTGASGLLKSLSSKEIEALDAGAWFGPQFKGEHVPRLEPYLRWAKGRIKFFFDVKDADVSELVALVRELGLEGDCFFWFGNPIKAIEFRRVAPDLTLKVNAKTPVEAVAAHENLAANIIEVRLDAMTDEMIRTCRERGMKIMVYHPTKDLDGFAEVIRRGADMINLNHGDAFKKVQDEMEAARP